jgi:hypothetical protein
VLTVHRLRFLASCAICVAAIAWGSSAHAAAQVSKFNLVLSANPTTVDAKDFNERVIDRFNRSVLDPKGLEGVKQIKFAWLFDAQMRYFVRPNFAVEAGVGQLKSVSKRSFLPAIGMAIDYRAELLSVPVHVGGAYYLPAYNQGDFQARWYMGGGITSLVYNRAKFAAVESNTDSARTLGGDYKISARRDSPGFYLETGVHMFFGGRYSVLMGGMYRSSMVRQADGTLEVATTNGNVIRTPLGKVFDIDTSGIGGKMALAIGF